MTWGLSDEGKGDVGSWARGCWHRTAQGKLCGQENSQPVPRLKEGVSGQSARGEVRKGQD